MDDSFDPISVQVDLGPRSYEVVIASGQLDRLPSSLTDWLHPGVGHSADIPNTLIITDENLAATHAQAAVDALTLAGWRCELLALQPGETSKSLEVVSGVYDRLAEMQADRQTPIVAVGGGVVGDVAGFAAATYARGLPFVQVPTSLLAQVDSSVGGKVGVNHPRGKNLVGAFHQPQGVFIDTSTIDTLPDRDYRSGLAEVVKYGVILDADFFEYLEAKVAGLNRRAPDVMRAIVARSCRLKADVVEKDEFEQTGLRSALNYGHTFAHAYEALAGYGQLLHGEAVAIGMIDASRLAERMNRIDASVTERQVALLDALGLPVRLPAAVSASTEDVLRTMQLDKKVAHGKLRFVLPDRLGRVELVADVPEEAVRAVLNRREP